VSINSYRDLKVWQLGMELAKEAYLLARGFPKDELYGLTSQLRRATVSIPANVAEGHAKDLTKEFLRHISIAQGSLAETETHPLLSEALGFANHNRILPLLDKCAEERRMLSGLRRRLNAKLEP
jgi:four helix bundle protein